MDDNTVTAIALIGFFVCMILLFVFSYMEDKRK
jgi:hypothetical protein